MEKTTWRKVKVEKNKYVLSRKIAGIFMASFILFIGITSMDIVILTGSTLIAALLGGIMYLDVKYNLKKFKDEDEVVLDVPEKHKDIDEMFEDDIALNYITGIEPRLSNYHKDTIGDD